MALTGNRYVGSYQGHTIELVRTSWAESLSLWIDGKRAATAKCIWPWPATLTGTLEHDGVAHAVVARSFPRLILRSKHTIEVDGQSLPLRSTAWSRPPRKPPVVKRW